MKALAMLIAAIIQVETSNRDPYEIPVGKHGEIGPMQIRPETLNDINRICGILKNGKHFELADRYSKVKSAMMFEIYTDFYCGLYLKNHGLTHISHEMRARCWNSGYGGIGKHYSDHYWEKVKGELCKQSAK